MPGSIRTRHPRPTEAGTKASWQEFLHSEPRARGTSPPPPQKNQPPTPPAPESCLVGLEYAPPGSSTGGGKKDTGRRGKKKQKKKSQDLPLHRRRLNKRPGEVDYFFSAPTGSFSRLPVPLLPPCALHRRLPRPPPQRPGRNEPWAPSFLVLARQEAAGP